jgi:hypothetical protein
LEEIKAKQRSREREIIEGDKNAAYFYCCSQSEKKEKNISYLEDDGVVWDDNDAMLKHAMNFYKTLFGEEPKVNIRLGEAFWSEDEMVKIEENKALEADFSEEVIKNSCF